MKFVGCSVDGIKFGGVIDGGLRIDFCQVEPKYGQATFEFYDRLLVQGRNEVEIHSFLLAMALCHSVNAEKTFDGQLIYKAQSPDEAALVGAARNFGFVYLKRSHRAITLSINGEKVKFTVECTLEFDSDRKRMSVIIVDSEGKRHLYCKGADSSVFPLLQEESLQDTEQHLHEFASDGLRTLVFGYREIGDKEWGEWWRSYQNTMTSIENREEELAQRCKEIEKNLRLLGVSAVEDKLQKQVPETLIKLGQAGIKIWVLTGDKKETARNIGYSCGMISEKCQLIDVDAELLEIFKENLLAADRLISEEPHRKFALIISGNCLKFGLEMQDLFLQVACRCASVICCRVAPLQKGQVVDLVKRKKQAVTLAIGDGGNDVNMIKTANIGVGISGKEGRQAVLASDFSIAQFRFLQRLLLVHGRWAYLRVALFIRLFFYKTFVMTMCHIWYGLVNGWSAQTMFDAWYILGYNLFFTSAPVFYLAVFERDVDADLSLRFPNLYQPGIDSQFFNFKNFLLSQSEGIFESLVVFWTVANGFSVDSTGSCILLSKASFSIAVGTIVVVIVTLRCCMETSIWTPFQILTLLSSLGLAFLWQWSIAFLMGNAGIEMEAFNVAPVVWSSANFWLSLFASCAIAFLPVFFFRFINFIRRPSLSNRVQILNLTEKSSSRNRHRQNGLKNDNSSGTLLPTTTTQLSPSSSS